MKIMENPNSAHWTDYHMKIVKTTMMMLGIWPVKTRDFRETLYETYFLISFTYYIMFNISGAIFAISTWSDNYLTTASSMGIVIEYVSNAYKVLIFKSKTVKALIQEITDKEKDVFNSSDSDLINIYVENSAVNKKVVLFYTIMGTTGISLYFLTPLISNVVMPLGYNNETGVKYHHFIVFSWFPFDPNRYYSAAYVMQLLGCLFGYAYIVHCGAFYISILSFVTGQLKIMQHILTHFSKYAMKFKYQYNLTDEQSQFFLVKVLIEEHLKIIKFVQITNNSIRLFTLINFVISSFQLSLLAYQILQLPMLQQITVLSYFITLSTQLFLTYQAAHIITLESENIASSIFKGNWETYPSNILKMLQIICIRAQRPLVLTIGPIADVKLTSLFQIFKALYSYICIIMRV